MKLFVRLFVLAGLLTMAHTALAAEPAVDKEAMMAQIKERTTPRAEHKVLEGMAGSWTYETKFWMSPEAQPEASKGSSKNAIILGGRFLKEESEGTWNGEPFLGTGYTGFDNVKGEYVSVWIDSVATGIMHSSGQYDEAKKTFAYNAIGSCPMTGEKDMKMRLETVLTDKNHYTMSGYRMGPDGAEFKGMEIAYTRVS